MATYVCVKTHYDPEDRRTTRPKRKVIKEGDKREFIVPPQSAVWQKEGVPAKTTKK